MASSNEIVAQDPNAHVFYDVDWEKWLTARGFLADGSEIVSTSFNVPSPLIKTHEVLTAAVARVYVKNVTKAKTFTITCTITMPEPTVGAGNVTDDFSFQIRGKDK